MGIKLKKRILLGALMGLMGIGTAACGGNPQNQGNTDVKSSVGGKAGDGAMTENTSEGGAEDTTDVDSARADSVNWFASLDTVNLAGEPVTKDVFQEADLTLINTWATWCNPCVGEIPELDELAKELEAENKKVAVKGLVLELDRTALNVGLSDGERELVNMILEQTGAEYEQWLVSDGLAATDLSKQGSFPTTYFVDRNGIMVGDPVLGAKSKEDWKKIIDERLEMLEK